MEQQKNIRNKNLVQASQALRTRTSELELLHIRSWKKGSATESRETQMSDLGIMDCQAMLVVS